MAPVPKSKKVIEERIKKKKEREKMVGVSKKKGRRLFTYDEADLVNALESIKSKSMGYREACRFYGVPFSTVHDRLSGKIRIDKKPKVGPDPVLGVQGEEKLSKWVLDMAKCGFPLSKQSLLESVSKIISESGLKNPFKDGVPGETWYKNFLKRHPEISVREPEGINNARAAITEGRIRQWFQELKAYVSSINATEIFEDATRIFNGDETGFSLCPKTGKVLGPKGFKNLYVIKKTNDKENITALITFSASGKLCPPLVIFPYVRPPKALVDNMPDSWVLGRSESGWMKSDVFYEYVTNDFNNWLIKNNVKKPIILFIDGHKSHMTYALSEFCQNNGIILYALPPNSTHMLQPADVSVFRPLKQNWKNTVKQSNDVITKLNFCKFLNNTLLNTELSTTIKNGFRKCGLYPLNENNVDYTKCVKDTKTNLTKERRERHSGGNSKITAKDYESAKKVISTIKNDLAKYNIDSEDVIMEIENAKTKYLENRRSTSKTPRNSAVSNLSNSILNLDKDLTPENLTTDQPETNTVRDSAPLQINLDLLNSIDENISFPENIRTGSFISLNNISVIPLDEIDLLEPNHYTNEQNQSNVMVIADVPIPEYAKEDDQIPKEKLSFDDVFQKHLHFPESTPALKTEKQNTNRPKLPSAISSQAWRDHYKKKEEEKENVILEKKRKQELRMLEKEKKIVEREKRKKKKKVLTKKSVKRDNLKCSKCDDELISDIEDDQEKNIGCDKCVRWFHLKCTELREKAYEEAAISTYECINCKI